VGTSLGGNYVGRVVGSLGPGRHDSVPLALIFSLRATPLNITQPQPRRLEI